MKTHFLAALAAAALGGTGGVLALASGSTDAVARPAVTRPAAVVAPIRCAPAPSASRAPAALAPRPTGARIATPRPVVAEPVAARPTAKGSSVRDPAAHDEVSSLARVRPDALSSLGIESPRTRRPTASVPPPKSIPAPGPERRAATEREVASLRAGLSSVETAKRLVAVRRIRVLLAPELEADVRTLLDREPDAAVKRVAVQILANGDARAHVSALERLRRDEDPIVRFNASFGLARAGDAAQRAWLGRVVAVARDEAPELAPFLAAALLRA